MSVSVLTSVSKCAFFINEPVLAHISLVLLVDRDLSNQLSGGHLVGCSRLEMVCRGALRAEWSLKGIFFGEWVCLWLFHWDKRSAACHIREYWWIWTCLYVWDGWRREWREGLFNERIDLLSSACECFQGLETRAEHLGGGWLTGEWRNLGCHIVADKGEFLLIVVDLIIDY